MDTPKLSKAERRARAEKKKAAIRMEIFKVMLYCADRQDSLEDTNRKVNGAVAILEKRCPQESHFVRSVCAEIRRDPQKFAQEMLALTDKEKEKQNASDSQ